MKTEYYIFFNLFYFKLVSFHKCK